MQELNIDLLKPEPLQACMVFCQLTKEILSAWKWSCKHFMGNKKKIDAERDEMWAPNTMDWELKLHLLWLPSEPVILEHERALSGKLIVEIHSEDLQLSRSGVLLIICIWKSYYCPLRALWGLDIFYYNDSSVALLVIQS